MPPPNRRLDSQSEEHAEPRQSERPQGTSRPPAPETIRANRRAASSRTPSATLPQRHPACSRSEGARLDCRVGEIPRPACESTAAAPPQSGPPAPRAQRLTLSRPVTGADDSPCRWPPIRFLSRRKTPPISLYRAPTCRATRRRPATRPKCQCPDVTAATEGTPPPRFPAQCPE